MVVVRVEGGNLLDGVPDEFGHGPIPGDPQLVVGEATHVPDEEGGMRMGKHDILSLPLQLLLLLLVVLLLLYERVRLSVGHTR